MDNPQLAEAWYDKIKGFTVRVIEAGMKDYFKVEEFFPVPGTLIPHIEFTGDGSPRTNRFEPKPEELRS